MSAFIEKALKGMSVGVYIRHIILVCIPLFFPIVLIMAKGPNFIFYIYFLISMLLYPYARFAYESVFNYIIGNNFFLLPLPFMLGAKAFTMIFCWALSIFIAPIGLLFLYYFNTKYEKEAVEDLENEKALYVEKKKAWEAEKAKNS